MATLIQFTDPNDEQMSKLLKGIPKCPGTCIFIDIVSSTQAKYTHGIEQWGKKINNTFNFISLLNDFPEYVIKGIGDEMMIFLPDKELRKKKTINTYYGLLEEIHATISNLETFPIEGLFCQCKVALHHCTEAYNITFLKGFNDYYGIDIDLTARLMGKARANRLIFSDKFYLKARNDLNRLGITREMTCLKHVSGKVSELFKGIPMPVIYRYIDVG